MARTAVSGTSGGDGSVAGSPVSQPTSTIVPTAVPHPDTSLPLVVSSFKLTGHNFIPWSRSIQLLIRGKGKYGYLDGSIPQPASTDPSFSTWEIQNSLVMSWLILSMDDSIAEVYLLYPTAKAIWDAVTLAYSDLTDSSQMFALRNRARTLRQDDLSVTQYFNSLTKLWQELDLFNRSQ